MHSAASVAYPVARSRRVGLWFATIWSVGASPVLWWMLAVPTPLFLRLGVVAWTVGSGAWLASGWLRTGSRTLLWDGQAWSVERAGSAGASEVSEARVSVSVDLQSLMLLRLQPAQGRVHWVFADRAAAPLRWHGLRCAVTASGFAAP